MKTMMIRSSILLLASLLPISASALTFNNLFVFGDSLSDSGNVYNATLNQFPPPPYAQRFSNGLVTVEQLAVMAGISLNPSTSGGTNYAFGGADTGIVPGTSFDNYVAQSNPSTPLVGLNGTGMQNQVAAFGLSGTAFDPNTSLFVVWGGANDIFTWLDGLTPATIDQVIGTAVSHLIGSISTLASLGAKNFLVPNLVDLGYTPLGISTGGLQQLGLSQITNSFNAALNQGLDSLASQTIFRPDLNNLFSLVQANPSAYGFTNVTDACFDRATFIACPNPDQYLFWDGVHPTTTGHAVLATGLLAATVAEPSAMVLMLGLGILFIGVRVIRVS